MVILQITKIKLRSSQFTIKSRCYAVMPFEGGSFASV